MALDWLPSPWRSIRDRAAAASQTRTRHRRLQGVPSGTLWGDGTLRPSGSSPSLWLISSLLSPVPRDSALWPSSWGIWYVVEEGGRLAGATRLHQLVFPEVKQARPKVVKPASRTCRVC